MSKIQKQSPVTVLLLSLVTCGIYWIVWEFKIAKEINEFAGREVIPMWVPIVGIFFVPVVFYFVDAALVEIAEDKGFVWKSKFVMWLLTWFCCSIGQFIYMFQVQTQMNSLADMQASQSGGATIVQ